MSALGLTLKRWIRAKEDERRHILSIIDHLIDSGYGMRHPLVVALCDMLEVGPDWQEDGE